MSVTEFKTAAWSSRFWKIKAIFRAAWFAYKYPRHVQISIDLSQEGEYMMNANYSGVNEKGFMRVLTILGDEAKSMERTEQAFKDILTNSDNDNNEQV